MTISSLLTIASVFAWCQAHEPHINPTTGRQGIALDRWMLQDGDDGQLWWRSKFWPPRKMLAIFGNPTGAGWLLDRHDQNKFIAPDQPDVSITKEAMMARFKMRAFMTPFRDGSRTTKTPWMKSMDDRYRDGEGWPVNADDVLNTGYEVKNNKIQRKEGENHIPGVVFVPTKLDAFEASRQPVLYRAQAFRLWGLSLDTHEIMLGEKLYKVDGWPPVAAIPPPPPPPRGISPPKGIPPPPPPPPVGGGKAGAQQLNMQDAIAERIRKMAAGKRAHGGDGQDDSGSKRHQAAGKAQPQAVPKPPPAGGQGLGDGVTNEFMRALQARNARQGSNPQPGPQ